MGATLDTFSIKPKHKFFERYVDNNLDSLYNYLTQLHKDILYKNIFNVPEDVLKKFNELNGAPTQLGNYYNIFKLDHPGLVNLKKSLNEMIVEACSYYNIEYSKQEYLINGWFNLDYKSEGGLVSPLKKPEHFHDHSDGLGIPWFHGYYCVNAEPSSTFYQIDRDANNIFENVNKNNRAIVSETGHPHGRDDWYYDKPRITIAYDITPSQKLMGIDTRKWAKLSDE